MSKATQYCTFVIDEGLFGLEVERVQEILRPQEMTPVPLAHSSVRGLINIRGQIVPAIDLRQCLGLAEASDKARPANVVVRTDDGPVSFLVDEIGDILLVDGARFEAPPDNLRGSARALIRGVFKLDGELLMVLGADETIRSFAADRDGRLEAADGFRHEPSGRAAGEALTPGSPDGEG